MGELSRIIKKASEKFGRKILLTLDTVTHYQRNKAKVLKHALLGVIKT